MKSLKILVVSAMLCCAYSTSNAQSQAGNPTNAYWDGINLPMVQVETGVWAIYSGDVNQDGTVDAQDLGSIENDASTFAFGYNVSDLTGDGATDALDLGITENNAQLFLFVATP